MITTLAAIQLNYKKRKQENKKKTMTNTQSFFKRPSESRRLLTPKNIPIKMLPKLVIFNSIR